MKIQSISIVPEDVGCNNRCKFCIARMTPRSKADNFDRGEYLRKLEGALKYAASGNAQTAIITSKGETLLSGEDHILEIIKLSRKYLGQIDLHTNGTILNYKMLESFHENGLTNITLSVPSLNEQELKDITESSIDYGGIIGMAKRIGLVVRLSCVVNKRGVRDLDTMLEYIGKAKRAGAHQIVFRELWIPKRSEIRNAEVRGWSEVNFVPLENFRSLIANIESEGNANFMFSLPWGEKVYDIEDMNIACATCTVNYYNSSCGSALCSKENTNTANTIKSVVFLPDGHLYSSWEFKGSIIM